MEIQLKSISIGYISMRCFFIIVLFFIFPALIFGQSKALVVTSNADKIYSKVDVEAEFKGGVSVWVRIITKNLMIPDSFYNNSDEISQPTALQVVVYKTAKLGKIKLLKGGQCLEKELTRVIRRSSGEWTQAIKKEELVNSFKRVLINCLKIESQ